MRREQTGTAGLASRGDGAAQILIHYYTGPTLGRIALYRLRAGSAGIMLILSENGRVLGV